MQSWKYAWGQLSSCYDIWSWSLGGSLSWASPDNNILEGQWGQGYLWVSSAPHSVSAASGKVSLPGEGDRHRARCESIFPSGTQQLQGLANAPSCSHGKGWKLSLARSTAHPGGQIFEGGEEGHMFALVISTAAMAREFKWRRNCFLWQMGLRNMPFYCISAMFRRKGGPGPYTRAYTCVHTAILCQEDYGNW